MAEKIGEIGMALGLVVGGAVLLIPALVILLQAAVGGLAATGLAVGWASLIVGGVALVIGLILLAIGINRLKAGQLVPSKTLERRSCSHSASEEGPWNPRARGLSAKSKRPAGNYRGLWKSCGGGCPPDAWSIR
jgi:hypothetical protein